MPSRLAISLTGAAEVHCQIFLPKDVSHRTAASTEEVLLTMPDPMPAASVLVQAADRVSSRTMARSGTWATGNARVRSRLCQASQVVVMVADFGKQVHQETGDRVRPGVKDVQMLAQGHHDESSSHVQSEHQPLPSRTLNGARR